jgi:cardiolipin synthase
MVVDGVWSFIGSANWDARSLRLNFEFNVECYSPCFARQVLELIAARREPAHPLTLTDLEDRHLLLKVRDRIAWLWSPYL